MLCLFIRPTLLWKDWDLSLCIQHYCFSSIKIPLYTTDLACPRGMPSDKGLLSLWIIFLGLKPPGYCEILTEGGWWLTLHFPKGCLRQKGLRRKEESNLPIASLIFTRPTLLWKDWDTSHYFEHDDLQFVFFIRPTLLWKDWDFDCFECDYLTHSVTSLYTTDLARTGGMPSDKGFLVVWFISRGWNRRAIGTF